MNAVRVVKKGELVFREGDKITSLSVVQSGGVNLCLQRNKKTLDLMQVGTSQVLGEAALGGATTYTYSAVATTETKVLDAPIDQIKGLIDSANPVIKTLVKSMADRLKLSLADVRNSRLEKDGSPCPDDQAAAIFAAVFHTFNHKGEKDAKNPKLVSIDWSLLKQYCQRVFGVIPKRVEQVINILVKFKTAKVDMGKAPDNPDGPDEMQRVHITDISQLEAFFEFWQYYYFKGGRSELLKFDETSSNYLSCLVKLGETLTPDRFGVVQVELSKAMEFVKAELGLNLNPDTFARLEQRGVFAKRAPKSDGVVWLQFEIKEFQNVARNWRFIREIDKWNEKGFVDINEETVAVKKKNPGEISCPQCSTGVPQAAKFCPECGFKLTAEKAG